MPGSPAGTYTLPAGSRRYIAVVPSGSYTGDITITVVFTGELKTAAQDIPYGINDYTSAWNLNRRSLHVQFVPNGGDPTSPIDIPLLDETGALPISLAQNVMHQFITAASGFGTPDMLWDNLDWPLPQASYWRDVDGVGHLQGRAVKKTGDAPVAAEVIATLPLQFRPTMSVRQPVVTGDDDGEEIGALGIDADTGEITWAFGRSTDPATKHPFVSLDGITFPASTF